MFMPAGDAAKPIDQLVVIIAGKFGCSEHHLVAPILVSDLLRPPCRHVPSLLMILLASDLRWRPSISGMASVTPRSKGEDAGIGSASKLSIYRFASTIEIMMHGPTDLWNDDNAIYEDGEWITWTEINSHLERLEFQARFPNLDVDLVPIFQRLLEAAADYHELTGRAIFRSTVTLANFMVRSPMGSNLTGFTLRAPTANSEMTL